VRALRQLLTHASFLVFCSSSSCSSSSASSSYKYRYVQIRQRTSKLVRRIRQRTPAYVSTRQHTSAYERCGTGWCYYLQEAQR
jgi:hypothetical protein